MSKIEAGRAQLAPEVFDLPSLFEGIEQMFAGLARAKNSSLSFDLSPELPRLVETDPGKLRQIVINLLSNALKFTMHGGVSLRATWERHRARGATLRVVVADTGLGIGASDLERIFGTFEQTRAGARAGGTGLGLPIGRHLARMLGGDLTAKSRVGAGSTFTLTFEVGDVSIEARAKLLRSRVVGLKPGQAAHRILAVDDVPDNVNLATSLLSAVSFQAQGAASGEAGIELHDRWQPHLVLMDLRMPGMGGLEAIRRLRAAQSEAVLVAFTASGFEELTEAALAHGANDVIFKPYRETQLLETIADLLHLELAYEGDALPAAPEGPAPPPSLASLLKDVPPPLRQQLRDAVLQARAQRVESLAEEVGAFSAQAATQVRELVRDFRFDDLAAALAEPS